MSILQEAVSKVARPEGPATPPGIDLRRCPPNELAAWLLAHRFQDNAMDVAKFLLSCTSALPDAEEISAQLLGEGEVDEDEDGDDDGSEMDDGENDKSESEAAEPAELAAVSAEPATKPTADPQSRLLHDVATSAPLPAFGDGDGIEVSCVHPRGKFLLSVRENGVVLTNPKKPEEERIPLAAASVENVVWFRRPEDYKKVQQMGKNGGGNSKGVPGHVVLICLADDDSLGGIAFRKKPLKQVCFQLPAYPPSSLADGNDNGIKQLTEETWWNGLGSALFSGEKNGDIVRVHASMETPAFLKSKHEFVFESEGESGSTTTTQAMPYVGCYRGFNDGALFPLREGLLFFKPPLFVPRSKLASISCGRGTGGSRYVDMVVQLEPSSDPGEDEQEGKKKKKPSDETLEFTNIHRDELTGLNDYIHKTLIPAMQMDADGTDDGSDDDDDDSEEVLAEVVNSSDDDKDRNNDSDDEEGTKRRPSRAASKSAREITRAALESTPAEEEEEDDDDEDEFEEEDSDESDSDESVVSEEESQSASSDEVEEEEEDEMDDGSDGSDYEDRKPRKKARVE